MFDINVCERTITSYIVVNYCLIVGCFFFRKETDFVAVFYDNNFYMGQILSKEGGCVLINFLKKKGIFYFFL